MNKKTITVALGGESFSVEERTARGNQEWRARVTNEFKAISSGLTSALNTDLDKLAVDGLGALLSGVETTITSLFTSPDVLFDLLVSYSPVLEAKRDWILDNATDSQINAAFMEVLKLAYPFATLIPQIKQLSRG